MQTSSQVLVPSVTEGEGPRSQRVMKRGGYEAGRMALLRKCHQVDGFRALHPCQHPHVVSRICNCRAAGRQRQMGVRSSGKLSGQRMRERMVSLAGSQGMAMKLLRRTTHLLVHSHGKLQCQ